MAAATRSEVLHLYRQILRTAARWPSVKRDTVIAEIKDEFRQHMAEADAGVRSKLVAEARAGLDALRQQCGMSSDSAEISYAYDDALSRR